MYIIIPEMVCSLHVSELIFRVLVPTTASLFEIDPQKLKLQAKMFIYRYLDRSQEPVPVRDSV
jgi:hypothetical protein